MPEPQTTSPRDVSGTLVKGLAVLSAFDETRQDLTMPQIVEITGLDRAAVRRLVLTLAHLGYLQKSGRSFRLTPRVLRHAGAYLRANRIGALVQPVLNRFAEDLGSTISLAALDDRSALYIAQSTARASAPSLGFTVGSRLPAPSTAVGRMLLAGLDRDAARALIRQMDVIRHTPRTETDPSAIARAVDTARVQGWITVDGEFEAGAMGLAVPVAADAAGPMALGMSEPSVTVGTADAVDRCIGLLQACANTLARSGAL
ncbi:IclR family transcriptional regulator C-terminal domain-containing protein [Sulfitobacter sp. D35]|uniref:IclR family transcriptional regulator domain-containing protein n=1 Tax=Sulfitobacter sp. D35 TaxID=3083252 RepID=UPI00296E9A3D|nr:IclR family transcriptional regulator C-terminal domain-containing protein [Sulfitobacter sp. D35]MDW4498112.1 IclR family transcriptional regulator C-terminal domain-containing protein [Sulfitobacter sp. D35]